MFKFLQMIVVVSLYSIVSFTYAKTTLYNGNGAPETAGWLVYGQIPFPESSIPLSLPSLPSSLKSLIGTLAEGAGTPTLNTDLGLGKKGYAGYSNYQYTLPELSVTSLLGGASKLKELLSSGNFELVNATNPVLDRINGFDIVLNVAITQESSDANRAGFNVLVVTSDGNGVELGFKKAKAGDRIFAQSEEFKEAENTSSLSLDFTTPMDYILTVEGDSYTLSVQANYGQAQEILSGNLRQFNFNPAVHSPALPFNPYTAPNLLFIGDDTDQGNSTFTLGKISVNLHTPVLGKAHAVNQKGEPVKANTQFKGGVTIKGLAPQIKIVQDLSDETDVSGEMTVDAEHVGQLADIIVYAVYKPSVDAAEETEVFYMLDEHNKILAWDGQPEHLVGFQPAVNLSAEQFVQAYQGKFLVPGYLCISFGYLLRETGDIITNPQCLEVTIKE